jgi:hypothetical protein
MACGPGGGVAAKGSGLGRMTHGPPDLTHGAGGGVKGAKTGTTTLWRRRPLGVVVFLFA